MSVREVFDLLQEHPSPSRERVEMAMTALMRPAIDSEWKLEAWIYDVYQSFYWLYPQGHDDLIKKYAEMLFAIALGNECSIVAFVAIFAVKHGIELHMSNELIQLMLSNEYLPREGAGPETIIYLAKKLT